jgi:hypothetical protein
MLSPDFKKKVKDLEKVLLKIRDDHCASLFAYLTVLYPEEIGFNALLKVLQKEKKTTQVGFSRNTLSNHLNHLLADDFVIVREDSDSNYRLKPRYYKLSPFVVEIFYDVIIRDDVLFESTILDEMKNMELKKLTITLIDIMMSILHEVLIDGIMFPDNIAEYNLDLVLQRKISILVTAYKKRVLEYDEQEAVFNILKEFTKKWVDFREDNWGPFIS